MDSAPNHDPNELIQSSQKPDAAAKTDAERQRSPQSASAQKVPEEASETGVARSPDALDTLTAEGLKKLRQEFAHLRAIPDPLARDYCLIKLAKASEIGTDEYRQMFEAYQQRSAQGVEAVKHLAVRTVRLLGEFTIVLGLLVYIFEADTREQETYNQAWQIITEAEGRTDNAGRIQALQTLNQRCSRWDTQAGGDRPTVNWLDPHTWRYADFRRQPIIGGFLPNCVSLRGLDVQNAHLPKVSLPFAELRDARLQRAGLWSADLRGADLTGAILEAAALRDAVLTDANLENATFGCVQEDFLGVACTDFTNANLSQANLSRANLTGSELGGIDLERANLTGTNLTNADLANADLTNATLGCVSEDGDSEPSCTNFSGANLVKSRLTGVDLVNVNLSGANLLEADLQGVTGLTLDQVKTARNWEQAVYADDFRARLGLPADPATP